MLIDEAQAFALSRRQELDLRVLRYVSLAHSENNKDSHALSSTYSIARACSCPGGVAWKTEIQIGQMSLMWRSAPEFGHGESTSR